jgi:hypothetical protein
MDRWGYTSLMGPPKHKIMSNITHSNIIKTDDKYCHWIDESWTEYYTLYCLMNQWTPKTTPEQFTTRLTAWKTYTFDFTRSNDTGYCDHRGINPKHITPYFHIFFHHCPTHGWLSTMKSMSTSNLERLQGTCTKVFFNLTSRSKSDASKDIMLAHYRVKINPHTGKLTVPKKHECPLCHKRYAQVKSLQTHINNPKLHTTSKFANRKPLKQ